MTSDNAFINNTITPDTTVIIPPIIVNTAPPAIIKGSNGVNAPIAVNTVPIIANSPIIVAAPKNTAPPLFKSSTFFASYANNNKVAPVISINAPIAVITIPPIIVSGKNCSNLEIPNITAPINANVPIIVAAPKNTAPPLFNSSIFFASYANNKHAVPVANITTATALIIIAPIANSTANLSANFPIKNNTAPNIAIIPKTTPAPINASSHILPIGINISLVIKEIPNKINAIAAVANIAYPAFLPSTLDNIYVPNIRVTIMNNVIPIPIPASLPF